MNDDRFDIEHFPKSETALRMMERISPIYEKSYVGKWIFEVMGADMDDVRLRFAELALQAFPETATWGLFYWEMRYGIPISEGKDIYLRRQEILSRRSAGAPLNPKRVEGILSALTGREVIITEDVAPYTFAVEVKPGDSSFDLSDTIRRLRKIKPSHQTFAFQLTLPTHAVRTAAYTETRLTVEIWPETVTDVALSDANMKAGALMQQHIVADVWPGTVEKAETTAGVRVGSAAGLQEAAGVLPGTVERVDATAKAHAAAAAQQNAITRIWPGAVERVETRAGAAGVTVETHQTIEIWP